MRTFNRTTKMIAMLAAAGLGLAACATDGDLDDLEPEDLDPAGAGGDGKFEAWNSANNPAFVDPTFLFYAHQLPLAGQNADPIPGDYWAVAHDGLNHRWDGSSSLAPSEKYAKAFNKPGTMIEISEANGVLGSAWRKSCSTNSDCTSEMDSSICAHPKTGQASDATFGRCIPTWWGICHGWAPFALVEPTAKLPVTRTAADGTSVTFYPADIIGLMSLIYTDVPTKFLSARCNKDMPNVDSNGRVIMGECRDMNAGSWHVLVTNMLGLRKKGFVLDKTYDDEVWNQPSYKYAVTNGVAGELKKVTKAEAISLLGLGQSNTALFGETEIKKGANKSGDYTATAAGKLSFKMTGSGDADLYIKKGSAPTASSYDCRPYESTSNESCDIDVASGDKVYYMVDGYADSKVSLAVGVPSATATYTYNTNAVEFRHVEMDFAYVVEATPSRNAITDITPYVTTQHYEYLLEIDQYGKIIGGEWLGASLTEHPDFAWWPTGTPASSVAGVSYADIKSLNDESAGPQPTPGTGPELVLENWTFTNRQSKYVAVSVAAGVDKLEVTMTGTGDADLYVRRGQNPTVNVYGCKSAVVGTSSETCTLNVAATGGTYYLRAKPRTDGGTTISLSVRRIEN